MAQPLILRRPAGWLTFNAFVYCTLRDAIVDNCTALTNNCNAGVLEWALFTFCLLLTDAATALLLISLAPLWAALLGVVTMGEPLPRRTVIALGLSVCSVGLVFMPRLFLEVEAPDRGPSGSRGLNSHGSLAGDLLALFTGLAQATSSATRTWPLAPALTGPPSPR